MVTSFVLSRVTLRPYAGYSVRDGGKEGNWIFFSLSSILDIPKKVQQQTSLESDCCCKKVTKCLIKNTLMARMWIFNLTCRQSKLNCLSVVDWSSLRLYFPYSLTLNHQCFAFKHYYGMAYCVRLLMFRPAVR